MTGCPHCGHAYDRMELVAKRSCPNCKEELQPCESCDYRFANCVDLNCVSRDYHCSNGRPVFRASNGILHHHLPIPASVRDQLDTIGPF